MQYALLDGSKAEARKGLKGVCMGCGKDMIPRCGESKFHHWAHRVLTKCDSWRENETIWHREWKDQFSESYREISFYDEVLQEYHRADVHTPEGLTIEFQNSSLSLMELQSREAFYQKLIWVINGLKFKGFSLGKAIPDPKSPVLDEYELNSGSCVVYTRKSERYLPLRLKDKFTLEHPAFNHIQASNIIILLTGSMLIKHGCKAIFLCL